MSAATSDGAVKETVAELPSSIGPLLLSVAVGATFLTVTLNVLLSVPPSLSVTLTVTISVAGPSA